MIAETYKGIRPALVIPLVLIIWKTYYLKLLNVEEEIGVTLTESMAMWPASSVSGYYFGNPESKYFGLGKIKEDQVIMLSVEVYQLK
jgi:5-methyltetrahydrofolate--homocysteine methyltransferase